MHIEGDGNELPAKIQQVNNALWRWPNNVARLTMFDTSWTAPPPSLPQLEYG
jgi:hypothetical protein